MARDKTNKKLQLIGGVGMVVGLPIMLFGWWWQSTLTSLPPSLYGEEQRGRMEIATMVVWVGFLPMFGGMICAAKGRMQEWWDKD